ncbi:FtsX-like permease family protein [Chitinophaga agrisoli]|uniref:FtsX-like permease family protein n=1 Tax=Chitinophaga agrisoli TaxID=2607653 RepID=A0A5B2VZC5_9BACT|nr:ABC transporter permease [Chitinophaga agrisoli]KAA2243379.1 FtsX-like permease family protein [Chitinophaga agrisoli]
MLKNYLKIAFRNLRHSKLYSAINITGLATGMAVALLIGLWIWDEVSFDTYHRHYKRIAQVMVEATFDNVVYTGGTASIPMGYELRDKYADDFKHVTLVSYEEAHILATGDKKISQTGVWAQEAFPDMFLKMVSGTPDALKDPSSLLLAQSTARALFGDADPLNQILRLDNKIDMKVAGVYEDLPYNTTHRNVKLLLPWRRYVNGAEWIKKAQTEWENHMCRLFVQLADHANIDNVNRKIATVPTVHITFTKEALVLIPMEKWHLYSEFKDGLQTGGRIGMVRLIGAIGIFVLLLACINFMNLSTARSEKRSREVGIRKAIGSFRGQLIGQFLSESLTVALLALVIALLLVQLSLPFFNGLSDKLMSIPWSAPLFWLFVLGFTLLTGLVSGSYPAFYLSGFEPVKVLKGTFRAGRFAAVPRKALVVIQFTVSIALMISTFIVYRQVQHARHRPVGYTREGLITIDMNTPDIQGQEHYDAIRNELLQTGAVADMAQSNSATTEVWSNNLIDWKGKDPATVVSPGTIAVSHDFGNTVGWTIKEGRDFSRSYPADTGALILNESAVKLTGFKEPIGQVIRVFGQDHPIIGVIKDMVMESPYAPVLPVIFHLNPAWARIITVRIKPGVPLREGLAKISAVFARYNPGSPFVYKFIDEEYAKKFNDEERVGNLITFFAVLAIFISCLGLFGLASFVAEKRTKEIGIRKVLGASVFNLWQMLSKDFVGLVVISCAIAIPLAWYFLHRWLLQYNYRTQLSWWIFAIAAIGALLITLATVSYQAVKAAVVNPVNSLKAE